MALWDRVQAALALAPWDHPPLMTLDLDSEIQAVRAERQQAARPWRPASINEALGVPAIYGATSLITNISGSLSMRAYGNGAMVPYDQRPRLIVRPNPFSTPREFISQTVFSMASRGEGWWWVGARDADGMALSLIPVPAYEVTVDTLNGDWLHPRIYWRGRLMKNADMIQIPLMREPGGLRGFGPLQKCGAAISVAVESQEWAANFFADGGHPSILLHSTLDMTEDEVKAAREQWTATPPNMPQATSGGWDAKELGADVPAAQMLEGRDFAVGDVARMFNIPGSLIEYGRSGSQLTYSNITSEFDKLLKQCLLPNYLEPIEQAISDLLPRSWVARFNADGLLRADIKTRFDVYESAITKSGVLTVPEARAMEGYESGDVENAPVPQAAPQAVPSGLPVQLSEFRCPKCNRKLAEMASRGTMIRCRCGELAAA